MSKKYPGFRLYHLLIATAYVGVVLRLWIAIGRIDDSIHLAWALGGSAVALPWIAAILIRNVAGEGPTSKWAIRGLLASPVAFCFLLLIFQKELGLDPEFGASPLVLPIVLIPIAFWVRAFCRYNWAVYSKKDETNKSRNGR